MVYAYSKEKNSTIEEPRIQVNLMEACSLLGIFKLIRDNSGKLTRDKRVSRFAELLWQ